uniref:Sodium/calcium exchanger membrane region domain-containing protein n=1 Tax=Amphora coffeiformis TaxID=265554 RepID=A0A7S3L734_9STRA|mmetsp:Transcript_21925/g.41513  ORF Transcript_21925/g.41513 Transcript_21925/m.41513 type:complete len:707 (+) Transcript_21925:130-2250(+)|eukprot:scaffold8005_cov275-Amphora_coffeaeformis.AAC.20
MEQEQQGQLIGRMGSPSFPKRKRRSTFDAWFGALLLLTLLFRVATTSQHDMNHQQQDREKQETQQYRQLKKTTTAHHHHLDRAVVEQDFSAYSCDNLYEYTALNETSQCAYAQTCNDGEGIFVPAVYCSTTYSPQFLSLCWGVPLILFLLVLFRILGSTAEEFFSPGLEMMSLELGLPERFAGVTLLALGNGAPDVASTVSAILNDKKLGYRMALGELTGAAMVASTLIVGAVTTVATEQVTCRAALIRDVVMFIITMVVVYWAFDDGSIVLREIRTFVGMYLVYVLIVLTADVYHRKMATVVTSSGQGGGGSVTTAANEKTALVGGGSSRPKSPSYSVADVFSNYGDNNKDDKNGGDTGRQHQQDNGGWGPAEEDGTEPLMVFHPHHGGLVDLKLSERFVKSHGNGHGLESPTISSRSPGSWREAWSSACPELKDYCVKLFKEMYHSDKYNALDKFFMTCELPFTFLRMLTIPVPCDGYYCRPLVALSIALCPFWIWYYMLDQFDVNIVVDLSPFVVFFIFSFPLLLGLAVLRWAPCGEAPPKLSVAVPITLIGFIASATWLDLVADTLVSLLSFFGIICHIPSTIMGLTILAWGNSSQDLVANMTVARKGLSTMAITASFAGPVFNILVGLGIGMAVLHTLETPGHVIEVELNNPLKLGFLFSVMNGVLVIVCGVFVGKGILPKKYGYLAIALYFAYAMASLTM